MNKQKDFEKGWEEYKAKKKKAVEEIGQDIADICSDMALNCCGSTPCYACIAKRLERKGYRKIPENAVVLTREEYKTLVNEYKSLEIKYSNLCDNYRLCKDANETLKQNVIIARNETAEKYHNTIKELFNKWDCCGYVEDRHAEEWYDDNDKIYKEIIGG